MPKMPLAILKVIESCFETVYQEHGTEDRILIYVDQDGNHVVGRPDMTRSAGGVECDVPLSEVKGDRIWDLVFDLHSHHIMGLFWSSTDDRNERLRGPVFGVCSWQDGDCKWLFRRWKGPEDGFEGVPLSEVVADG